MGKYKWSNVQSYPAGNITLFNGFTGNGVYTFFEKETSVWLDSTLVLASTYGN